MKPAAFDYVRPDRLEDAADLLAEDGVGTKIVSGAQSLGPMLNLRLVRPGRLLDVTAIPALRTVEDAGDAVVIGACITHADIEDGRVPDAWGGMLRQLASGIAYRAVRNRGTVGGSLCHADPAADWLSILTALGAEARLYSRRGRRTVALESFVLGAFETALAADEILEAVRIPKLSGRARWGYSKSCRKAGEFAHAIGVVVDDPETGRCRAVIGATETPPILVADARGLLSGDGTVQADWVLRLLGEAGMQDPFEQQIHLVALERAGAQARL
ncbi:xanthine dehydrogenase family protein subunit M [Enterovirga sp.]|jgi:carbon-monoxide dehydrogenase medium subunit|uniref:FAD binding domain-containing protein n=1 Tax=Enterovirga sp. TaxID=2026350 RepID=UPI002609A577|nr:FAD binding domain-containing protein [Enterovirga sp.]MDB5591606.1 molybdopterin dehydrogenase FAD-binding [Enterovirga sp.]